MSPNLNELTNKTDKLADAGTLSAEEKVNLKTLKKEDLPANMELKLKANDGKSANLKIDDVVKAIAAENYLDGDSQKKLSSGIEFSKDGKTYTIGWGSEAGALIQAFLINQGQNNIINESAGIDGKIGSGTLKAIKDYVDGQRFNKIEEQVKNIQKNTEVIDNPAFFKEEIAREIFKMNLNNRVKDPSVKNQLKQYVDTNGALNTDKYTVQGTSYDKMIIVFDRNISTVKNRSVPIKDFIDQSGNFDQAKFVTRFEDAIKNMIAENQKNLDAQTKADELSKIRELKDAAKEPAADFAALTGTNADKISDMQDIIKEHKVIISNFNKLTVKFATAEKNAFGNNLNTAMTTYNNKLAEVTRGNYADMYKGNKLVDKSSKLADATDISLVSSIQGSINDLKSLKMTISKDMVNYAGKAADKTTLLTNIDAKIKYAEGQIKFINIKKADGDKITSLEKSSNGNLSQAAQFLDEFKNFQTEFKSHTGSYLTYDNTSAYEGYASRMNKLETIYYALRPAEKPAFKGTGSQSRQVAPGLYESSDI